MKFWLITVGILIIQEIVTTNKVLIQASQYHHNLWAVHCIFIMATIFDLFAGYALGRLFITRSKRILAWLEQFNLYRFARPYLEVFVRFFKNGIRGLRSVMGKKEERLSLVFLGTMYQPYITSFFAASLNLQFKDCFLFLFLGNAIWYVTIWLILLGISTFIPNPLGALIAASVITIVSLKFASKLFNKNRI